MTPAYDSDELAYLLGTGFFGISKHQAEEIAEDLRSMGVSSPSESNLYKACRDVGVDPDNLTSEDVRYICELL